MAPTAAASAPRGSTASWRLPYAAGGINSQVKANNIEPYRYLVALFKKLPLAQTADDYEALLPWNIEPGTL